MLIAVGSGLAVTYRNTKRTHKRKRCGSSMGNAFNHPDTKKKMKAKMPRGEKAINRSVEVLYSNEDGTETWQRGTIIMYNKSKG